MEAKSRVATAMMLARVKSACEGSSLAEAGSRAFSRVAGVLTYAQERPGAVRTGLIGASIKASLSPALHEREGGLLALAPATAGLI